MLKSNPGISGVEALGIKTRRLGYSFWHVRVFIVEN